MLEFILLLLSLVVPAMILSVGGFLLVYELGLLKRYGIAPEPRHSWAYGRLALHFELPLAGSQLLLFPPSATTGGAAAFSSTRNCWITFTEISEQERIKVHVLLMYNNIARMIGGFGVETGCPSGSASSNPKSVVAIL